MFRSFKSGFTVGVNGESKTDVGFQHDCIAATMQLAHVCNVIVKDILRRDTNTPECPLHIIEFKKFILSDTTVDVPAITAALNSHWRPEDGNDIVRCFHIFEDILGVNQCIEWPPNDKLCIYLVQGQKNEVVGVAKYDENNELIALVRFNNYTFYTCKDTVSSIAGDIVLTGDEKIVIRGSVNEWLN